VMGSKLKSALDFLITSGGYAFWVIMGICAVNYILGLF